MRFFNLGNGQFLGLPNPIWITIVCFIVFGVLLNNTSYGKNTLAMGGNMEATRLAGVAVDKIKIMIFTIQGMMAGFAGVVLASRMTSGQPNTSIGFSLDVISACVLGGVSLSGGVAPIQGAIVGVLIMGTVQNSMNLMNIPTFYQYVVRGTILLIAVLIDRFKQVNSKN
jgi:L-arabinose transport system permease protein